MWNTEDIIFKFVQIKFLAMHIKKKNHIFTVGHLQNILMKHDI